MLVDDHPLWRQTLRTVLEHKGVATVVAEASDGVEALELAGEHNPFLVVMDIDLPGMDGIEATRKLLHAGHALKVLVLSAFDDKARVAEAVKAGAAGYLLKTASSEEIADAVQRIQVGELVFPPALAEVVLGELRQNPDEDVRDLRVCLAADSVLRRQGLAGVLRELGCEVTTVGEISELEGVLPLDRSDVVVIALGPRSDALLGAVSDFRSAHGEMPLLLLADDPDSSDATELVSDGDSGFGYFLSDRINDVDELRDGLSRVFRGESVIDPGIVRSLVGRSRERSTLDELTAGERDVLALMAEGRSNQAISERLFLSPKTVEARVGSIFAKLGLPPAADDHRRVLAVVAYLRST